MPSSPTAQLVTSTLTTHGLIPVTGPAVGTVAYNLEHFPTADELGALADDVIEQIDGAYVSGWKIRPFGAAAVLIEIEWTRR
jgi:hypothetical protein